jgi:hypothetical protein
VSWMEGANPEARSGAKLRFSFSWTPWQHIFVDQALLSPWSCQRRRRSAVCAESLAVQRVAAIAPSTGLAASLPAESPPSCCAVVCAKFGFAGSKGSLASSAALQHCSTASLRQEQAVDLKATGISIVLISLPTHRKERRCRATRKTPLHTTSRHVAPAVVLSEPLIARLIVSHGSAQLFTLQSAPSIARHVQSTRQPVARLRVPQLCED